MAGTGSMMAWIAGGAVALLLVLPAPASACEAHQKAARAAAATAKAEVEAKLDAAAQEAAPKQAPAKPELHAEKCKCDGPSTCTCQKGQCQCAKCNKPRYKVMESLRERAPVREVKVRRNAAAGTFI